MSSKNKGGTSQPVEKKKRQRDIGWKHGEQVGDNRQHVQCNYCHKIMKGGGVSRLKQHLAGGFSNVERCDKCPSDISKAMREYLNGNKAENEKVREQRAQMRENLMGDARRRSGIKLDESDDSYDDMTMEERDDLEYARQQSIRDIHMAEQGYRRTRHESSSQKGGVMQKLMRSHSVKEAWKKMSTKSEKGNKKGLDIHEMTPSLYRNKEVQQAKLTHMWNPKKWAMSAKHAIAKFFIYENIPPIKAQGHFYQLMIDEIALAGPGFVGPTPYEIGGPLLDDEMEELKEYIQLFKKKFQSYGVTIMCDGWSSTTRLSIINFLVYCDGKVIFHKSHNASDYDKDATYIFNLMDSVVQEIGDTSVVQIITDNGSAYKKAGEMLMQMRPNLYWTPLYWTPCAAHSLDLILHDFAGIEAVSNVLEKAKRITNFIYNHNRILAMYRTYCSGELIRPGQTRFGTNYIALQSILEHKSGLQRMFTSDDWAMSAGSKDPMGKRVQATILDAKFWEKSKQVVDIHAPIAKVLKMVDGERRATMPYVYEAMMRARKAITEIAPKSCKKYLDIVDTRWKKQIIRPIHMAAYYLNPAYQYGEGVGVQEKLLGALRTVVSRLEPNANHASQALAEVKIFREAMYGFSDQAAIRGRTTTDPAEWWFMYGTDAPKLRKIAMRILSQTASSSGCERNWSTFALIHTKVRNRLNYEKLEKLVFAQYNMRLKVKHMFKEQRSREFQPIDLTTVFEEDEENTGLSEWLDDPGDALLDELDGDGQPNRPNTFLATWANTANRNLDEGVAFDNNQRGSKGRGKQPMISSDNDDDDDDDSDDGGGDSDSGGDNNNDEDVDTSPPFGGSSGGNVGVSYPTGRGSQSPPGIMFTEEQGFTHATQDEDHGSRRMLQYARGQGKHCHPHNRRQNSSTAQGIDDPVYGVNMINTSLSGMSISGDEHYGHGSSSSYAYNSGYDSQTYGDGHGSGYESQVSSSRGYGYGQGQTSDLIASFDAQQSGCSQSDYKRFRDDYEAWFSTYMSWNDYCQHVQNTYNVPLAEYSESGPIYAPARHSTAGWM